MELQIKLAIYRFWITSKSVTTFVILIVLDIVRILLLSTKSRKNIFIKTETFKYFKKGVLVKNLFNPILSYSDKKNVLFLFR